MTTSTEDSNNSTAPRRPRKRSPVPVPRAAFADAEWTEALRRVVKERIDELKTRPHAVAEQNGVKYSTLLDMLNGSNKSPRFLSFVQVAYALGWSAQEMMRRVEGTVRIAS